MPHGSDQNLPSDLMWPTPWSTSWKDVTVLPGGGLIWDHPDYGPIHSAGAGSPNIRLGDNPVTGTGSPIVGVHGGTGQYDPYPHLPDIGRDFFALGPFDNQSLSLSESGPEAFTPAQRALQRYARDMASAQLGRIGGAEAYQRQLQNRLVSPYGQMARAGHQAQAEREMGLERQSQLDSLFADELQRLQQGPEASPEQQELINQIAESRIQAGSSDIQAALQDSLGLLRSELAPSRGFRPEDTPIQDRGQVLAKESLRLTEDLINQARGQQAQQLLDYPLAASQLRGQQVRSLQDIGLQESQFGRGMGLSLQQFQDQLRTNDLSRRLAVGEQGLQLAGLGPTNIGQFIPPGTSSTNISFAKGRRAAASGGGSNAGAAFAQGVGTAIGAAILSSKQLKENKQKIDFDEILQQFKSLDVERWNYTFDPSVEHIGPYAEDFKKLFGIGLDDKISVIDQGGVAFAAIKALLDRVEKLEAKLDGAV